MAGLSDRIDAETIPGIMRNGNFEEQKHICRSLIQKIVYTSGNDIRIEYRL
jgi:hypothetical protein